MKYTLLHKNEVQIGFGLLAGTGSWTVPDFAGLLPFASLSVGDRRSNFSISGGYGSIWSDGEQRGRALMSVAGMARISPKISLVFDSFILLPKKAHYTLVTPLGTAEVEQQIPAFAIIIPGIRWHNSEKSAFQFGFSGMLVAGDILPVPIPMDQWFRRL